MTCSYKTHHQLADRTLATSDGVFFSVFSEFCKNRSGAFSAERLQSRNQNKPQKINNSAGKAGGDALIGSCGKK